MPNLVRPMLAAAMLGLVSSVAMAQNASAPGDASRPLSVCSGDLEKFCPGKSGLERRQCMRDNTAKLSPACAAAFADIQAKAKAMREACQGEIKTVCADVTKVTSAAPKGPGGPFVQCLRANVAKLSAGCATAFKARYPKG